MSTRNLNPKEQMLFCAIAFSKQNDCLLWPRYRQNRRTGHIQCSNMYRKGMGKVSPRRAVMALKGGKVEGKNVILSSCSNNRCVNPNHLYWGTASQARILKGTSKGENNPNSKLTQNDVYDIRRMIKDGIKDRIISEKYGVTDPAIYSIRKGRTWSQ